MLLTFLFFRANLDHNNCARYNSSHLHLVYRAPLRHTYICIMHNVHTLVLDSLYDFSHDPRRDHLYDDMTRRDNRDKKSRSPMLLRNRSRS